MTLGSSRSADVTVSIAPRAIAKATLAAVVLVAMVLALRATRSVIANIAIAAVIACLLRPGVLLLSRRMRTGLAIVAVYGAFLAGLVALLIADASALHTGATELRHFAPDRLAQLQQNLPPGNALRRFLIEGDVVARIRTYVNSIPSRFLFGTSSPLQGASQVAVILLIISLSGFMISRGPSIFHSVVSSLPTRWQPGVAAAGRDGYNTGGAYIRRTIVLCFPCALAASGLALACGVPGVGVLGVWVGMWAVIPRLGIAVGGLPLAALAFGQGTLQGTGALAGLAVIVVAGEAARVRWIERPTVKVGPFFSLVAVMAGMELGRWWGALVLLTAAAFFAAASDGRRIGDAGPEPAGELPEGSGGKETTSVAPASAPLSPTRSRISIDIDGWSLVLAAGLAFVVVVIIAFGRALPQSLTRLIVAVFFALALNRLVGLVQRRLGGRRGLAVAAVTVVFVAGLVAFSIFAIPQAVQQSRNVGSQAQSLVTQLDSAPIIGSRFRQSGLDDRLRNGLSDLPHILATHDQALSDGARSAGEAAVAFGWILLIGIGAARRSGNCPPVLRGRPFVTARSGGTARLTHI